ncbi:hypothetical protein [Burkholderia sp. Tr-20390]|uniref:hypothetical protein n=1 Tax=Burkholderia sp. Tr-20390 TaxID=2703904 RepID=UPI001981158C|nr:hypothetical protein [Burkholderia sp. Tr-20390]MBN3729471.1 hypothetical protein [Burkholderia sp. Tr-20390]
MKNQAGSVTVLEAGYSGVRPTPQAVVEAFLTTCYPGSRKDGPSEEAQEGGYALQQAFTTVLGDRMLAYLNPAASGGWRVAAKARVVAAA